MDRRSFLLNSAFGFLSAHQLLLSTSSVAQESAGNGNPGDATPFSFELLTEAMRERAQQRYRKPEAADLPDVIAELTYDQHRAIRYRPDRAVWKGEAPFELQAFHMGWLFDLPVKLHTVKDGLASPLVVEAEDFEYRPPLDPAGFEGIAMPGVAGFRLHHPLNDPDVMDELVSFLGASYFRALGRNNLYGLSARGLAINTATDNGEEFPVFTDFYIESPDEHSTEIVVYAALDSPSITGAYEFRIVPGENTLMDVTARLFIRNDIARLGIAPMTSMFLFGENNSHAFDDYRDEVHDSDGLKIGRSNGEEVWRSLNNPVQLANSFFAEENPESFGLFQRDRAFDHYQDAGAGYHRRPSLLVEPLHDWGKGVVHLVEIPTDLEINDNIVAYWIPEGDFTSGRELEFRYRLTWGAIEEADGEIARVVGVRAGEGGVSGVEKEKKEEGLRKFVVDFKGEALRNLAADSGIEANLTVSGAEITQSAVSQVENSDIWRLAMDIRPGGDNPIELRAFLSKGDRRLSETWSYQWRQGDGKSS